MDGETAQDSDGRIDLNLATAAELMTLSGIGQTKADSIIRYREKMVLFFCGGNQAGRGDQRGRL